MFLLLTGVFLLCFVLLFLSPMTSGTSKLLRLAVLLSIILFGFELVLWFQWDSAQWVLQAYAVVELTRIEISDYCFNFFSSVLIFTWNCFCKIIYMLVFSGELLFLLLIDLSGSFSLDVIGQIVNFLWFVAESLNSGFIFMLVMLTSFIEHFGSIFNTATNAIQPFWGLLGYPIYYFYKNLLIFINFLGFPLMIDGLSFSFILLSSFIFLLCNVALIDWNVNEQRKKNIIEFQGDRLNNLLVVIDTDSLEIGAQQNNLISDLRVYKTKEREVSIKIFVLLLFCIHLLLFACFASAYILQFYIAFELLLLPMIYLIAIWGSQARKSVAIMYFFMYTLFGSLLMLLGIIILFYDVGTTDMTYLLFLDLPLLKQKILWFLFFFGFAIKIPMFPFHIWLPEAHVEAPTIGSVILAALLLKLGSYGMIRILLGILPDASKYYSPLVLTLAVLGIVYASIILLSQIDLKRIIAYSSIAHMNFGILGLFSGNSEGVAGGIFLMLAHGISSSALFFLVGMLYDRYHTRELLNYGGLTLLMPILSFFFFLFSIANFGFPGTFNFLGEFLVFLGIFITAPKIGLFAGVGLFFSIIYSMLLYNRIFFGELNSRELRFAYYTDITLGELIVLLFLGGALLIFGIASTSIFELLLYPISFLLLN